MNLCAKNKLTVYLYALQRSLLFVLMCSLLVGCESRRFIVNDLDEKEANEILVFLASRGISAYKVQAVAEGAGGQKGARWNISVEDSRANEAMALLNQVGLPRRRGQNLLSIFSSSSLVPSGMQEKIKYQAGLAEQIASTIRKIDGILDAEVQISFPEEDPLNPLAQKQKITASVFVSHSGVLDDPNSYLITRLKRLVAGSVPGLDPDNVTIIGDRARSSETPIGGFQSLNEEERSFVRIWSVVVSKDSLGRFQTIFFSFTIALVLLLISIIWILWRVWPLLKEKGGIRQLFSFRPFGEKTIPAKDKKEKSEEEAEEDPNGEHNE